MQSVDAAAPFPKGGRAIEAGKVTCSGDLPPVV